MGILFRMFGRLSPRSAILDRNRRSWGWLDVRPCLGLTFIAIASAAAARAAPDAGDVSGAQVREAVRNGVRALKVRQLPDGTWPEHNQPGGMTCLATLALLQAGQTPDAPAVRAALAYIRRLPDQFVYTTGLKLMVLARLDLPADRQSIRETALWLANAQNSTGLWNYTPGGIRYDHSNAQFALLGLHAAAEVGVKIPNLVWQRAQTKVLQTQGHDGGWSYQIGESYGSMTAAGVADLLVLGMKQHQGQESGFARGAAPNCGHYRINQPLAHGLDWLAHNFRVDQNPRHGGSYVYYWLYAVERCGILSGRRYFGAHDWYREGAAFLVHEQGAEGLWNNSLADTCFALLFLAKGKRVVAHAEAAVVERRRVDPRSLRRRPPDQLHRRSARPARRLAGDHVRGTARGMARGAAAVFPGPHLSRLERGAAREAARVRRAWRHTILAEACCGREEFRAGFEKFAATTFPEAPLHKLGADHAVYRLLHKLNPTDAPGPTGTVELEGIDLGCRTAVLFAPADMSCLWEQGTIPNLSERAFKLGTNIAAYAVGRRPLRDRLDAVILPSKAEAQPGPPPRDALRLAQIVYEGDWRPFPSALVRLAEFLRDEAGLDVVPQYRQVRLADPDLYTSPILYLAGHFDFDLPEADRKALAEHLKRGGFLIADACCGTEPFDTALRKLLKQMFPNVELEQLPPDDPLFTGTPGFDVTTVHYSPDVARAKPELTRPELWGLKLEGRLAVVYSPYSLGCGLSGPAFDGCWSLASEDAKRLAANIVLAALTK